MAIRRMTRTLLLTFLLTAGSAQALMVTGAFTGIWFDDAAPGQGFIIQVAEVEGAPTAVVYWFTFDAEGRQVWLYGQGPVDGETASMTLFLVQGGVLSPQGFDPSDLELVEWGALTLGFANCNRGLVSFTANDPAMQGEIEIVRLTKVLGQECTGGISDNVPPGAGAVNLTIDLVSSGEDPNARGRIKYEQNANHTKLKVQVFKLDRGTYDFVVDGEVRGAISTNNGGNGKLFLRSPECGNWQLLDFDPLDKDYEVVRDGIVYLSGALEGGQLNDGDDPEGDEDESDADDGDASCDASGG